MEKEIKRVLNIIEKNGYEAYVIGGYVRDLVLQRNSYDVDICTNALPKELVKLFPEGNLGIYGAIDFKVGKFSFEITTYRKEYNYNNRHPNKVEYINNLLEDIDRRDFTINTLCMNSKGNVIDIINGYDDILNKKITSIGTASLKIQEDPLRILRAIRFATILDFAIDDKLHDAIIQNITLVSSLSDFRIIDELTKILISDNYQKGLALLSEYGILDLLGISYNKVIKTHDINGMWAQFNFQKELAFTKETKHNIITIKKILEIGKIDSRVLFDYGLYYVMVASEIMGISRNSILSMYKKMPIKSKKELALSTEKIIEVLNNNQKQDIKHTLDTIVDNILQGNVKNKPRDLYRFIQTNKE